MLYMPAYALVIPWLSHVVSSGVVAIIAAPRLRKKAKERKIKFAVHHFQKLGRLFGLAQSNEAGSDTSQRIRGVG